MAVTYISMDRLGLQENTYARSHKFNVFNYRRKNWYGPVEVCMRGLSTWHGLVEEIRHCIRKLKQYTLECVRGTGQLELYVLIEYQVRVMDLC